MTDRAMTRRGRGRRGSERGERGSVEICQENWKTGATAAKPICAFTLISTTLFQAPSAAEEAAAKKGGGEEEEGEGGQGEWERRQRCRLRRPD